MPKKVVGSLTRWWNLQLHPWKRNIIFQGPSFSALLYRGRFPSWLIFFRWVETTNQLINWETTRFWFPWNNSKNLSILHNCFFTMFLVNWCLGVLFLEFSQLPLGFKDFHVFFLGMPYIPATLRIGRSNSLGFALPLPWHCLVADFGKRRFAPKKIYHIYIIKSWDFVTWYASNLIWNFGLLSLKVCKTLRKHTGMMKYVCL